MNATITRARRAAVAGLGGTALALTLAACGGGGDETATSAAASSAAATSEAASEAATSETATSEAASSPAAAPTQPATDADLEPAKQRFVDFYQATGNGDLEGACAMVLDPSTGKDMASSDLKDTCTQALESSQSTYAANKDTVTADGLDAQLAPDGTVTVSPKGASGELQVPIAKGADGQLYVDLISAGESAQS